MMENKNQMLFVLPIQIITEYEMLYKVTIYFVKTNKLAAKNR